MEDILARYKRDLSASPRREKGLYDVAQGEVYAEFLKQHGVLPEHDVLDFGCGYGRVAIPLLRYLNRGNYVGIDLSKERIRLAREYVAIEALEETEPTFFVASHDNRFEYLGSRKFDFIWARAVFGHMPLDDVRCCIGNLRKLLKSDGVLIGDYDATDEGEAELAKTNVKTYRVAPSLMKAMVDECGYEYAEIPDWEDEISPDERRPYIRMMRLTARR